MIILLFLFYLINSIVSNQIYLISSISSFHVILHVRKRIELIDSNQIISVIDSKSRKEYNNTGLYQPKQEVKRSQPNITINPEYKYNRFIHLQTTPYKNVGNKEIEFFHWNDGINYGEICNKILKRITQEGTFYVISDSTPGGIGHKYISLLHSLTYAILTGRRFISRISLLY